ncbi:putative aldehyde dehydrogenase-like protein C21C3 [Schizosaccharomyces pombe]|uniref:Putative aldehyde dehydrogenase-like protein C21C3 n=1 Tax=Schizosaccharomyces pombe (strain 972 / ATCC 24843) TaxID=284812 RepID=YOSF_SCHPO|nr:putative aldehyde dehydrogenase [Schizosaccharomyces pombe]Q9P7K9.1 RecName: Full=Putative aldehyde dehydrogenase-like protein C21C3 [Schizosaccharomyces pombe 972h-]CAB76051.1 aldehyde dehydrogenase (predicted) [Schizosaccharomyces pombe]|eukprot:NP_596595.1 putative aldehyde dehydrogenase [Schizosaccharomyces pombe]
MSSTLTCYCPGDGSLLGEVKLFNKSDIDQSIILAEEAQKEWKSTSFAERRNFLKALKENIIRNQDKYAEIACKDTGKTLVDAAFGEILVTLEKINWTLANGEQSLRPTKRPNSLLTSYKGGYVKYEPLGVIAALVSWNYPLHNALGPIISALFAGNAIVVKGSELTAWSTHQYCEMVRSLLQSMGHSPELVQCITCLPDVADHLTSHSGIKHITFIGSQPIAKLVAASAAKQLTPLCLELGGKDPCILTDDHRLEEILSIVMRGVFQSAGQNCIGIERIIALDGVYDTIITKLYNRISTMRLGMYTQNDVDMGAMVSNNRFDHLESLIQDAVSKGARLVYGGHRFQHPKYPKGNYFLPTLLVDATNEMKIAQEECFAPIALVFRAKSPEHALEIANGTEFGLGASVFGRDKQLCQYFTDNLETGMVAVNDFGAFYLLQMPFGGCKKSGYGRFAGYEGLRGICNSKAIAYDRFSAIHTGIPPAVDYPIPDSQKAWQFVRGLMGTVYGAWISLVPNVYQLWRNS